MDKLKHLQWQEYFGFVCFFLSFLVFNHYFLNQFVNLMSWCPRQQMLLEVAVP